MGLIAMPARPGKWCDSDQPLSDLVLADLAEQNYEGVFRYVPLPGFKGAGDISPGELARITSTKLPSGETMQCGLIQHPRSPQYNDLTKCTGDGDAKAAVDFALAAGYPLGAHLGLDSEGLSQIAANTTDVVIHWDTNWQAVVLSRGLLALMYVGYDVPLTPQALYELPGFTSYWSDAGHRMVAVRGCSMSQGPSFTLRGVPFDGDVLVADKLGAVPFVAGASSLAA
jgi:hypothetical protein